MKHNICTLCKEKFPQRVNIEGKIRIVHKRKYCLQCKPLNWKKQEIENRKISKTCKTCNEHKITHNNYHQDKTSADGFNKNCKKCRIIERKEHYQANKKDIKNYMKNYRKNNPEKIKAQTQKRLPKIRKYILARYHSDIAFKLKHSLRRALRSALKEGWKSGSAVRDLGCSIVELKTHLEKQFQPGMTWDNWSQKGWHIDHIKPLDSFDLTERKQLLKACHYTNLQPLWWYENLAKGNKT